VPVRPARVVLGLATVGALAAARSARRRHTALRAVVPDLRHPLLHLPLTLSGPLLRLVRRMPARPGPLVDGVTLEERTVPALDGGPPLRVLVYDVPGRQRPSGALLWIHGGGFVVGEPGVDNRFCSRVARELGVVVVSVDYRLAPEHPFPAGLEDCWSALRWLHAAAGDLGVDPGRIAIGGASAGGGLAATLAQLAHDRAEVPVAFQLLVYPMLDDRTVLRADHAGTGTFVWSPGSNRFGWTAYLGHLPALEEPRPWAAAARRADLSGLPPAWIGVGDLDLFHAEDVEYARRLGAAGVACELHVEDGMYHGADAIFEARSAVARGFRDRAVAALASAVGRAAVPG
jgi:acetyl esterase/lipase